MRESHQGFQRPQIMGVLNVTPDSFSDGGQYDSQGAALEHAKFLIRGGATIIDVGGESTRPGAVRVASEVEMSRVIPAIEGVAEELVRTNRSDVMISIDTMSAATAFAAVSAGASIINDVSGGLADPEMFAVAAETGVQLVISNWRGFGSGSGETNTYTDLATEVAAELKLRIDVALAAGVSEHKIILDPGLGFAKDTRQNWELVSRLDELDKFGLPILVGASRKRFIANVLDVELESSSSAGLTSSISNLRRDLATAVLTALLLQRKLWGVRVHNVVATRDAIAIVEAFKFAEDGKSGQS